jgi:hypothetical protein
MQMVNIYIKNQISTHFFEFWVISLFNDDLYLYLFDNLQKENYNLLRDLEEALTTNANGKYI